MIVMGITQVSIVGADLEKVTTKKVVENFHPSLPRKTVEL